MVELAIALFVVAVLAGATAYTLMHFAQTRAHYALRQTAAWAADGQLQRLMAGAPLDSLPPEGTISSGIELTIRHQGGDGVWSSMTLVCVQATVTPRHAKRVVEEACGYVTTELVP
jgi:type II secretory pathway pseudopilin PulG